MNRLDHSSRQTRLKSALFRGDTLTLANPEYFRMVRTFTEELLHADRDPLDITSAALGAGRKNAVAQIIANEPGVLAGIDEAVWYFTNFGLAVERAGADGQSVKAGQAIMRLEGDTDRLLSLERVGLNLLQRMSGIATPRSACKILFAAAKATRRRTQILLPRAKLPGACWISAPPIWVEEARTGWDWEMLSSLRRII